MSDTLFEEMSISDCVICNNGLSALRVNRTGNYFTYTPDEQSINYALTMLAVLGLLLVIFYMVYVRLIALKWLSLNALVRGVYVTVSSKITLSHWFFVRRQFCVCV